MNTSCPAITPYDWQLDLAGALALKLGATVIAGTGSKKLHFGPCLAPGTELWPDLPSHLAAEPARCGSCTAKVCVLEVTNHTIALLFLGSLLSDELRMPAVAVKIMLGTLGKVLYEMCVSMLTICAQIDLWNPQDVK